MVDQVEMKERNRKKREGSFKIRDETQGSEYIIVAWQNGFRSSRPSGFTRRV
jgi:hypothetical protein